MEAFLRNVNSEVNLNKHTTVPACAKNNAAGSKHFMQQGNVGHNFNEVSLFATAGIQPKLFINQPNDVYEQEADAMAGKVMRIKADDISISNNQQNSIQRKCKECEEEEKGLQRKESSNAVPAVSGAVHQTLQSNGQQLDGTTRNFMESRFGHDFSKVRVHDNALAHESAKNINALAYTYRNNIVFGANQYQPSTITGKKLLAHELTHVVQQQNGAAAIQKKTPPTTTPTPKDGKAQKQGGFIVNIDYIKITGLPDVYNSPKEQPHDAHTYLSKPTITLANPDYQLDPKTNLVTSFVAYKPLQIDLTIETNYAKGVKPEGPSDYGYGTRAEDKKNKNTSIKFHEGSHGTLFIEYIRKQMAKHPLPQFEGKAGMTKDEFLKKDAEYVQKVGAINQMILDAIKYATITVDCAGTSIDKHHAGRKGYVNICP